MKVKNEYIRIKNGKTDIMKTNMILDVYLQRFIETQLGRTWGATFSHIGIQLDEPLDVKEDDDIFLFNKFKLILFNLKKDVSTSKNAMRVKYNADNIYYSYEYQMHMQDEWGMFDGRKIYGIAFGYPSKVYAYLDLRNSPITIDASSDFEITRSDLITTDGYITGDVNYPHHLIPYGATYYLDDEYGNKIPNTLYSELYSIGFGTAKGEMVEEFILGDDVEAVQDDELSYRIILKRTQEQMRYVGNGMYPSTNTFASALKVNREVHPNYNLIPSGNTYPSYSNYKYIIYKYRMYYTVSNTETNEQDKVYVDKYFTNSIYNEKAGYLNVSCKMERND